MISGTFEKSPEAILPGIDKPDVDKFPGCKSNIPNRS